MFTRNIIEFKSKQTTDPSKLSSAIAHNINNADIRISCLGAQAVNAAVKALVIAKRYIQNENFNLIFDFFAVEEVGAEDGVALTVIQIIVSKLDKEVK